MSDQDPPPESAPPESPLPADRTSTAPPPKDERRKRRLEGVIPEIVRRAVELGVEKTLEAPDNVKQFVGDLKLPKEIAHYLLAQIDETKNGLFRVVAKEMRDFLEHTNLAGEMQKVLTAVQFEVNTTIRFTPNDGRAKKSKSRSSKAASAEDKSAAPPEDEGDEDVDDREDESEGAREEGEDRERTPLPRPEVKTNVSVHREDRDRRRRRS